MKIKSIPLVLSAIIAIPLLASCGIGNDQKWLYTRDDVIQFPQYEGKVNKKENTTTFKVKSTNPIFDKSVNKNDIRIFDLDAALEEKNNKEKGYLEYPSIKKHLENIKELTVNDELNEFEVTVNGHINNRLAILINKDVTNNSDYHAICLPETNELGLARTNPQVDFEEKYIKEEWSWATGGKFVSTLLTNIGSIVAGAYFASYATTVVGVFSLIGTLGDQFNGTGPTNKDLMNKLNIMDAKLDDIINTLEENHNQLMQEEIRTQVEVDKAILQTLESQMTDFTTDYIVPLDDYRRDFADYIEQSYKSYVKEDQVINMYLEKDEKGKWGLVLIPDEIPASQQLVSISISNFENAQEFLRTHNNIVEEGFMDEFNKDIEKAISTVEIPTGLTNEVVTAFAHGNIVDHFTQKYYQENHEKALDLRNKVINFSKRISGRLSNSILNTYISRFEYMYNFASEIKEPVIDLVSNIMGTLDTYAAMGGLACLYAETSNTELVDEYKIARESAQEVEKNISEIPDGLNFATNEVIQGHFYQAKYNVSFKDTTLSAKLEFNLVKGGYGNTTRADNITAHNYIPVKDHMRIAMRWNLMRQIGVSEIDTYADYLVSAKALDDEALYTYRALVDLKYIGTDCFKIMTGYSIRGLKDSDKSLSLICKAKADYGNYFTMDKTYKFRSTHTESCWNGSIIETNYIDGQSGTLLEEKKVAAYASYAQSKFYWITDEYWGFVDNPYGNYFFALEAVNAK